MFFYRSEISQSCKGTFPVRACAAPRTPPLIQVEILNRVFGGISLPVRDPKCRFPRKTIKNGGLRRGGREEREEIPSPPASIIPDPCQNLQAIFLQNSKESQKTRQFLTKGPAINPDLLSSARTISPEAGKNAEKRDAVPC